MLISIVLWRKDTTRRASIHLFGRDSQLKARQFAACVFSPLVVELRHLDGHVYVAAALKVFARFCLGQVLADTCQLIDKAAVFVRLLLLYQQLLSLLLPVP